MQPCVLYKFLELDDEASQRRFAAALNRSHAPNPRREVPSDYMDPRAREIYGNLSAAVGAVIRQNMAFYSCALGCDGCGSAPGCGFNETAVTAASRFVPAGECARRVAAG